MSFNFQGPKVRGRLRTPVGVGSLTKQSFKDECDINVLMKRYEKSGLMNHVLRYEGRYEDLPDQMDYQEALRIADAGREAFESLTGAIRARFNNDPAAFLAFVDDPRNVDEMRQMGLLDVEAAKAVAAADAGEPVPGRSGSPVTPVVMK